MSLLTPEMKTGDNNRFKLSGCWKSTIGSGGVIPLLPTLQKALNNKWIYKINDSKTIKLNMQYLNQPSTPRVDSLVLLGLVKSRTGLISVLFSPNERQFTHLTLDDLSPTVVYDTASYNIAWQKLRIIEKRFLMVLMQQPMNRIKALKFLFRVHLQKVNHLDFVYGLDFYSDTINNCKTETIRRRTNNSRT